MKAFERRLKKLESAVEQKDRASRTYRLVWIDPETGEVEDPMNW